MPDCREVAALLSEYLDRDLPQDTCSAIEAHLAGCAACREEASDLRRTVQMCRDYREGNAPGPLPREKHDELRAALEKAVGRRRAE